MTTPFARIDYPAALEPGQRPLLLFHRHLRAVRAAGDSLADYDILMFRPPAPETDEGGAQQDAEEGAWLVVPAAKYLKHRSLEWREAERAEDLPPQYHDLAEALDAALAADDLTADEPTGGAS